MPPMCAFAYDDVCTGYAKKNQRTCSACWEMATAKRIKQIQYNNIHVCLYILVVVLRTVYSFLLLTRQTRPIART